MKTNGTIKVAPAPGKPDINPVEPALIVGAFAIVQRKGTRKNHYDVFHVGTRAGVFHGQDNDRMCQAAIEAIAGLCDWDSIKTLDDFNALPVAVRQSIGTTWYEACETWRKDEKTRKLERGAAKMSEDARLREGVPYSEAPASKTYRYNIGHRGALLTGTVNGESWVSDGYLAHVGTAPDGTVTKDAPIQQVIPTQFEEEAYPVAFYLHPKGSRLVVLSNGVTLNYDMFKFLMRRFKGAVIKTNSKTGPVGYAVEGEIVAIQMPVIDAGGGLPANVVRILEPLQPDCVTC